MFWYQFRDCMSNHLLTSTKQTKIKQNTTKVNIETHGQRRKLYHPLSYSKADNKNNNIKSSYKSQSFSNHFQCVLSAEQDWKWRKVDTAKGSGWPLQGRQQRNSLCKNESKSSYLPTNPFRAYQQLQLTAIEHFTFFRQIVRYHFSVVGLDQWRSGMLFVLSNVNQCHRSLRPKGCPKSWSIM